MSTIMSAETRSRRVSSMSNRSENSSTVDSLVGIGVEGWWVVRGNVVKAYDVGPYLRITDIMWVHA